MTDQTVDGDLRDMIWPMLDNRSVRGRFGLVAALTTASIFVASGAASATPEGGIGSVGTGSLGPGSQGESVLTPQGSTRQVPADFFGLNGARIIAPENAAQWHDPVFRQALGGLGAGLLRVQGGTTSQWIDWRTGLFDEREGSFFIGQNESRQPLLLDDWAQLVRETGTTPVFDLNVLTSTLDEQIEMLRAAQQLGMEVRYVELGNELWDPGKYYEQIYPTGADYAKAMNSWVVALRAQFPGIEIAVSGADDSSAITLVLGERLQQWNDGLYANIIDADAVAIHPYWVPDPIQADIGATVAGGTVAWNAFSEKVLTKVPPSMSVWLSEYNQINLPLGEIPGFPPDLIPGVPQTWAVGLGVASFALGTLTEPRVTMSVIHAALDGQPSERSRAANGNEEIHAVLADGSGGSTEFGRTAINEVLTPIYGRARGGATVQALRADSAPTVNAALLSPLGVSQVPAVVGTTFLGDDPGAFLVNLSDRPIQVTLPSTLPATLRADTLTAPPLSNPAFTPVDTVSSSRTVVTGKMVLAPYSLTELSID
ncbi:hypothetical protein E5720_00985 [Rhodococcus sp. PAMC28707]|uniref:hypothetical protein n=1 Tax=unclassified Rhodococcus (in: high G+C Gram-positive bacteria) TaxID=192944 RepID=UPI00109E24E9|nr:MULTISPECIES: hypothetical protein [unclassified Rhodococcus (in: high G+C Gram-positive bacteria)]QCB51015.1 hypothetical protein E5769_13030 [Rhodococcus sp. PAMC28705]QCB57293.1 hypothetical protein E5720_00985 [Rhodococcus sp. PAMC28707]